MSTTKPLLSRPLDAIFFLYFVSHTVITIVLDVQGVVPAHVVPSSFIALKAWYVDQYKDPFVAAPNAWWFKSFMVSEAFLQLPFFVYAARGLLNDSPKVRLPMIVYGAHVATTTAPLFVELWLNNHTHGLNFEQQVTLTSFYLPYLLIPLVVLWDSYRKVSAAVAKGVASKGKAE